MFTMRPGTIMTFFGVAPVNASMTLASAMAQPSTVFASASAATVMRPRQRLGLTQLGPQFLGHVRGQRRQHVHQRLRDLAGCGRQ
jgi:hypothetical protein